ncbi:MAG: hypothetical protein IJP21_05700 [Clostridia bacterium]|nr:hypothetical protein [Clostridia bacterium]
MRKIISIILVLGLLICFCGCNNDSQNNNYKKIEYQNNEVFDKTIIFMIPDSWVYAETFDGDNDNLVIFRDELGQQIGNMVLNTLYSGEDNIFSIKEKIVPIDDAKYTKISKNCFITSAKGRGYNITYKIIDKAINLYFNISVNKNVVKQIAENIVVKDFEEKEETEEMISSSPTSSGPSTNIIKPQKPNIDFIEEPDLVNNAIAVDKIFDVYNAVGCNMHLMGRPNIGKEIYFENNYNTSTLQLYGDDGYVYMLIDNFRNKKFELAKLSEPGRSANIQNRDVILSKSLPVDCTLLTEYNEYMYNFVSQKSFINFEQADRIIMFPFLCQFLNKDSLMPEGFSISDDGMIISTKLYIPEVMAFLYITEDYNNMQAKYSIAAINGDTSHLSQKLNKYNTTKELRHPSGLFEPTDRFRYKEFGVIFP